MLFPLSLSPSIFGSSDLLGSTLIFIDLVRAGSVTASSSVTAPTLNANTNICLAGQVLHPPSHTLPFAHPLSLSWIPLSVKPSVLAYMHSWTSHTCGLSDVFILSRSHVCVSHSASRAFPLLAWGAISSLGRRIPLNGQLIRGPVEGVPVPSPRIQPMPWRCVRLWGIV